MNTVSPSLPIATARLNLRQFAITDFRAYADYHSRSDVYRFLYLPAPDDQALEEQFAAVLSAPFAEDGDTLRFAAARHEDGAVIGEVLLKIASKTALQAEVGYIFNPDFSGQGYATEAVGAMLDIGFAELGFHRIFARLDVLNVGSVGFVERLRMRREAHLIENDRFNGHWGGEYIYAMLKTEWTAIRSNQQRRS